MLSRAPLCGTLWTVGFFRQEYWSALPFPAPGHRPDPGIEPMSPASPELQTDSLPPSHRARGQSRAAMPELKDDLLLWGWARDSLDRPGSPDLAVLAVLERLAVLRGGK